MEPRRPRALEAGTFLLVVVLPLSFFPQSEAAFVDVKLLVLALATLLIWTSGIRADRRLMPPALAFATSIALATAFGVDQATSLVGDVRPTGLTMLGCATALVVVAPSIPGDLLARARGWLVGAAAAASLVLLVEHLAPDVMSVVAEDESFGGATFGNPVILAGFLAASIPAALARSDEPRWRTVLVFAALGSGFALIGERSAYVLPPVAFLAAWWFVKPKRRRLVLASGVMVVTFGLWILAPNPSSGGSDTDPTRVAGQFGTLAGEQDRIAVWGAQTQAIVDRPLLGWGPGNEWSAFVSSATRGQIETATRFWADAHNLVIEIGVIAGLAGLAAFAWLLIRLVPRTVRAPRARAWAAASAATLALYSLYEPLDVTLTPLMLVLAGAAGATRPADRERAAPHRARRVARAGVLALLVATTAVAGLGLVSSGLDQWGRTHFGSRWALERAWTIAPWRILPGEALAIELALDGRSGDEEAAAYARDVVDRLVEAHPRNPGVRLLAADVELLLRNFPETQAWIRRHLELFPNDDVRVPTEEPAFTLRPEAAARSWPQVRDVAPALSYTFAERFAPAPECERPYGCRRAHGGSSGDDPAPARGRGAPDPADRELVDARDRERGLENGGGRQGPDAVSDPPGDLTRSGAPRLDRTLGRPIPGTRRSGRPAGGHP